MFLASREILAQPSTEVYSKKMDFKIPPRHRRYYLTLASLLLLARLPQTTSGGELPNPAETETAPAEIGEIHERTAPFLMKYLKMLKSGDVFGAAKVSSLDGETSAESLRASLEDIYRMSTMAKWEVVEGWPFYTEGESRGFMYKVKISYSETHYFAMTGVVVKDDRLLIVGGLTPIHLWPSELAVPSVESPEDFRIGVLSE